MLIWQNTSEHLRYSQAAARRDHQEGRAAAREADGQRGPELGAVQLAPPPARRAAPRARRRPLLLLLRQLHPATVSTCLVRVLTTMRICIGTLSSFRMPPDSYPNLHTISG